MDELKIKIEMILNDFSRQELGNRLSTYAMQSLLATLLKVIDDYEKNKDKKGDEDG